MAAFRPCMKAMLCLPLLFAAGLWADEAQDRAAIGHVIDSLNDPAQRDRAFAADADSPLDFDLLIRLHRRTPCLACVAIGMDEPWTVLTVPRVVCDNIRFIAPDVALVDGASIIPGAISLLPRVPLVFVLKKSGAEWKISAVRVLGRPAMH
jgi:hypothetical protein